MKKEKSRREITEELSGLLETCGIETETWEHIGQMNIMDFLNTGEKQC